MNKKHKKPEINILHRIVMWNKDRGLLEKDFNLKKESAYILEEIFEAFGFPDTTETKSQVELLGVYDPSIHSDKYPRTIAKQMTSRMMDYYLGSDFVTMFSSDIADAFGDIIVFATGAIAKLGYDPEKIVSKIMDANDAKGSATDAEGKITKDESFVEPEAGFDDCLLSEEFTVNYQNQITEEEKAEIKSKIESKIVEVWKARETIYLSKDKKDGEFLLNSKQLTVKSKEDFLFVGDERIPILEWNSPN